VVFALCAPLDHCVLDSMLLLQYYGLSCMYACMYVSTLCYSLFSLVSQILAMQ